MPKHQFRIGDITIGGDNLFLISGPCVIEDKKIMFKVAEELKKIGEKLHIPIIYKSSFTKDNRSSVEYYQGPGIDEGLKVLEEIKNEFNLPIISDIHSAEEARTAANVLDIIQIPAYLCMQTSIVLAAANTGSPINLKHGQFISPSNMVKPVDKIKSAGNNNIILTERGYTFGYNDLIVDPRSFYDLNQIGLPVVFDVTHSIRKYGIPSSDRAGGSPEYLPTLARSATAAGIDGLFIETHPNPGHALCDAASQMNISDLEEFLKPLLEIHEVVKCLDS